MAGLDKTQHCMSKKCTMALQTEIGNGAATCNFSLFRLSFPRVGHAGTKDASFVLET